MPNTRGIDVSHYQQKIDWTAVAKSTVKFCYIKATEGMGGIDPWFARNWDAARAAGLIRGAYHFFHPNLPVLPQADLFVHTVEQLLPGDLPPVLDLEAPANWSAIPTANRAALAIAWLENVQSRLGAAPIVYMSSSFATEVLANAPEMARFPLWVAQYTSAPSPDVPKPWTSWTLWQYTGSGAAPGVTGTVDSNRFNGTIDQLKALTLKPAAPSAP